MKHEYLMAEDLYEMNSINKGRSDKTCEHCGKTIKQGTSHKVAKFYPEFSSYPLHEKCISAFEKSLRTGDPLEKLQDERREKLDRLNEL